MFLGELTLPLDLLVLDKLEDVPAITVPNFIVLYSKRMFQSDFAVM